MGTQNAPPMSAPPICTALCAVSVEDAANSFALPVSRFDPLGALRHRDSGCTEKRPAAKLPSSSSQMSRCSRSACTLLFTHAARLLAMPLYSLLINADLHFLFRPAPPPPFPRSRQSSLVRCHRLTEPRPLVSPLSPSVFISLLMLIVTLSHVPCTSFASYQPL